MSHGCTIELMRRPSGTTRWARRRSPIRSLEGDRRRDRLDEGHVELDAEAGTGGNRHVAVDDVDRLGHEVAGPEAPRRRDVAGQREARQCGEGGVGGAADAGLEHPPAPDRDAALEAQVVDAPRRQVPTDAAGLDVDDLGGTDVDRVGADGLGDDRLVEAHGRADRPGQLGVSEQVVLGQRLLDQQQVEAVELREVLDVPARVRRVRVDLERHVGTDQLTHRGDRFDVEAGLDLQLDADVAVVEVTLDRCEQGVDRRMDADADTTRDVLASGPDERRERATLGAQLGVEHGHLQRRLGHRMAAHGLEHGSTSAAARSPIACSRGTRTFVITRAAPSTYSDEYVGSSPATHSPQPSITTPSCSTCALTRRMRRLVCTPKLVWNGLTSGSRTSRSSTIRAVIGAPPRIHRRA